MSARGILRIAEGFGDREQDGVIRKTARILIVDDHPSVCAGLASRIGEEPDMQVCGTAAGEEEAVKKVADLAPDLVIVDLSLKRGDGLELIRRLARQRQPVRMLVHSMYDALAYAERCLRAGALGYVDKGEPPCEVVKAIREVLAGRMYLGAEVAKHMLTRAVGRGAGAAADPIETLTDRQLEVFRLLGEGLTAAEIARRLHRSVHTIESHRENIKRKLGAKNLAELACRAVEWVLQHR
jgi:DNA-binding NarL/FixJ family response regulator